MHTLDTCNPLDPDDNCVLEESNTVDPSTLWPTLVRVVKTCSAHKGLSDAQLYTAIIQEQKRRSYSLAEAEAVVEPGVRQAADGFRAQYGDLFSSRMLEQIANDKIDDLTQHAFSWDSKRKLKMTFPNLSASQKTQVRARVDQRLGVGKVDVE